jgi:hypothetical protein
MGEYLEFLLSFEWIKNTLIVLGLIGIYLNYRKFGFNVCIRYTVGTTPLGLRIKNLILENNRDKPVFIDGIYGCENKEIYLQLAKYDPPITLKSLDIIAITLPDYSELNVNGAPYDPNFFDHFEIFLHVEGQYRKCKLRSKTPQELKGLFAFPSYYKLDDRVYSREAKYIFLFMLQGVTKQAFVNHDGRVWGDWDSSSSFIMGDLSPNEVTTFFTDIEPNIQSYTLCEIQFSHGRSAHPKFVEKLQKRNIE